MSGPEGMPNGVDRLAQIEEWRKEGTLGQISVSDVLALVEIAKHAQPMADLPWPLSADERQEWIVKQNRLRSALARLDSDVRQARNGGGAK